MDPLEEHVPVLLGYRKNGAPIYLAQGGAPTEGDDDPGDGPDDDNPGDDGPGENENEPDPKDGDGKDGPKGQDNKLGQGGEKVLAELRAKERRDERAKAKLKAENEALRKQIAEGTKKPEDDKKDAPDPEQIRREAREQARTEVLHERALDKVEIAAAKAGFTSPEDARLFLANSAEEFIDGGKVDLEAIQDAVTELASKRPYLLAGKGKRFGGGVDQGVRGGGKPPSLDAQIAEAQKSGDLNKVLALQMQKLTPAK